MVLDPITMSLIGTGVSALGGFFGGDDDPQTSSSSSSSTGTTTKGAEQFDKTEQLIRDLAFKEAPEFGEAKGAREEWWETLQKWGAMPGFGAISPDFDQIWETAKSRVDQAFFGTPGGDTGAAGRVKASAARRNVSQSPAVDTNIANLGIARAGQLGDIATQQAVTQAGMGEQGRMAWLNSLMGLAGQRPQVAAFNPMQTSTSSSTAAPVTSTSSSNTTGQNVLPGQAQSSIGDLIGGIGSQIGALGQQQGQTDFFDDLMNKFGKNPIPNTGSPVSVSSQNPYNRNLS